MDPWTFRSETWGDGPTGFFLRLGEAEARFKRYPSYRTPENRQKLISMRVAWAKVQAEIEEGRQGMEEPCHPHRCRVTEKCLEALWYKEMSLQEYFGLVEAEGCCTGSEGRGTQCFAYLAAHRHRQIDEEEWRTILLGTPAVREKERLAELRKREARGRTRNARQRANQANEAYAAADAQGAGGTHDADGDLHDGLFGL